jgi:chromosome segregation ATPase
VAFAVRQLQALAPLRGRVSALEASLAAAVADAEAAKRVQAAAAQSADEATAERDALVLARDAALQQAEEARQEADVLKKGQETDIGQIFALQLKIDALTKDEETRVKDFTGKLDSLVLEIEGLREQVAISSTEAGALRVALAERTEDLVSARDALERWEAEHQRVLQEYEEEIFSLREQMSFSNPFTGDDRMGGAAEPPGPRGPEGPQAAAAVTVPPAPALTISSVVFALCFVALLLSLFADVTDIGMLKLF